MMTAVGGGFEFDRASSDAPVSAEDAAAVRAACLAKLPGGVPPPGQVLWLASDATVGRYLAANKGNAPAAAKQLAASLPWRESRGLVDGACHASDHARNSFLPVGLDRRKYAVIYSSFARADLPTNSNAEANFDHAFQVSDAVCDDAAGIQRTLWIIDFNGFGTKHICKRHISLGCAWFGAHNPERLGALVLRKPPRLFTALWSFIHLFLDPASASRIVVCRSDAEYEAYLVDACAPLTSDWLLAVARLPPSVGGGYPEGTDLSLVSQTMRLGPPTPATLALLGSRLTPREPNYPPPAPPEQPAAAGGDEAAAAVTAIEASVAAMGDSSDEGGAADADTNDDADYDDDDDDDAALARSLDALKVVDAAAGLLEASGAQTPPPIGALPPPPMFSPSRRRSSAADSAASGGGGALLLQSPPLLPSAGGRPKKHAGDDPPDPRPPPEQMAAAPLRALNRGSGGGGRGGGRGARNRSRTSQAGASGESVRGDGAWATAAADRSPLVSAVPGRKGPSAVGRASANEWAVSQAATSEAATAEAATAEAAARVLLEFAADDHADADHDDAAVGRAGDVAGGDAAGGSDGESFEEPVARCLAGHELRPYLTPSPRFTCSGCSSHALRGSTLWGCEACDFDLCPGCHATALDVARRRTASLAAARARAEAAAAAAAGKGLGIGPVGRAAARPAVRRAVRVGASGDGGVAAAQLDYGDYGAGGGADGGEAVGSPEGSNSSKDPSPKTSRKVAAAQAAGGAALFVVASPFVGVGVAAVAVGGGAYAAWRNQRGHKSGAATAPATAAASAARVATCAGPVHAPDADGGGSEQKMADPSRGSRPPSIWRWPSRGKGASSGSSSSSRPSSGGSGGSGSGGRIRGFGGDGDAGSGHRDAAASLQAGSGAGEADGAIVSPLTSPFLKPGTPEAPLGAHS